MSERPRATELLVGGAFVIAQAADRAAPVLTDGAVLVCGSRIAAVGDWRSRRRRNARARVVG